MIKLCNSSFRGGVATVKISTEIGNFTGKAFLHPEDERYSSEFLGCEIAEWRAIIQYYKKKISILNIKLLTYYDIRKTYKVKFDCDNSVVEQKIKQTEQQKEIYQNYIYDIKEAIEYKIEATEKFIDKIEQRKKQDK